MIDLVGAVAVGLALAALGCPWPAAACFAMVVFCLKQIIFLEGMK